PPLTVTSTPTLPTKFAKPARLICTPVLLAATGAAEMDAGGASGGRAAWRRFGLLQYEGESAASTGVLVMPAAVLPPFQARKLPSWKTSYQLSWAALLPLTLFR